MQYLDKLEDKLCEALEGMAGSKLASAGELDVVHKMTDTIKNIEKIKMLKEDSGYSERYSRAYDRSYDRGNSYKRDSMGRYSRDGYSRGGAQEHLEKAMQEATSQEEREAIRRAMDAIR